MAAQDERDGMLKSVERLRMRAGKLESELIELHNSVRFDHCQPGVADRARRIETQAEEFGAAMRELREDFERARNG